MGLVAALRDAAGLRARAARQPSRTPKYIRPVVKGLYWPVVRTVLRPLGGATLAGPEQLDVLGAERTVQRAEPCALSTQRLHLAEDAVPCLGLRPIVGAERLPEVLIMGAQQVPLGAAATA